MQGASMASLCAAALIAAALAASPGAALAQSQGTITVDTAGDVVDFGGAQTVAELPGPDGQTSLREAALATTNTPGPERIAFAIPTSDPGFDGTGFTIRVDRQLTLGDDGTTLDATTQPGGQPITVQGSAAAVAEFRPGLVIDSSGNEVIGLGIRLHGFGVVVDGGSGNVLRGLTVRDNRHGIQVRGATFAGGNAITNSTIRDNSMTGVGFINATGATITANTVSGSGQSGILMLGTPNAEIAGNVITGNEQGIALSGSYSAAGTASGNTIAGNRADAIEVNRPEGFTVTRNSIAGNGGLGIDLVGGRTDPSGVTRNSNGGPNFPQLRGATDQGGATAVEGRVDAADPASVTVELFASDAPDPSGFGEGQTFLGTTTPDTRGRFTATLPGGLAGRWLTATARYPSGTTSEFSEALPVAAAGR